MAERYLDILTERLDLLKDDVDMLTDVETQLKMYTEDMGRDFDFRMADIENILYEMDQRGQDFFDETMRLTRVMDLLKKDQVQRAFEQRVVSDVAQQIERKVNELIEWLVDSDLHQWQAVTDHIAVRRRKHKERIVGDIGIGTFHYDRQRLIDEIGQASKRVVDSYDRSYEAHQIAQGAQNAVAAAAAIEVGAVGLGTLVATIATTVAADVTGILLASAIAALGLFIIPARRRKAKKEMREKISAMRQQLVAALRLHFEREIDRSLQHINETISPYTRFVRAEQRKNTQAQDTLQTIQTELGRLRANIDQLE